MSSYASFSAPFARYSGTYLTGGRGLGSRRGNWTMRHLLLVFLTPRSPIRLSMFWRKTRHTTQDTCICEEANIYAYAPSRQAAATKISCNVDQGRTPEN